MVFAGAGVLSCSGWEGAAPSGTAPLLTTAASRRADLSVFHQSPPWAARQYAFRAFFSDGYGVSLPCANQWPPSASAFARFAALRAFLLACLSALLTLLRAYAQRPTLRSGLGLPSLFVPARTVYSRARDSWKSSGMSAACLGISLRALLR